MISRLFSNETNFCIIILCVAFSVSVSSPFYAAKHQKNRASNRFSNFFFILLLLLADNDDTDVNRIETAQDDVEFLAARFHCEMGWAPQQMMFTADKRAQRRKKTFLIFISVTENDMFAYEN